MTKNRLFDEIPQDEKYQLLIQWFNLAYRECIDKGDSTDLFKIACHYGGRYKVKKEDFDLIRSKSIDQIIQDTFK